MTADELLALYWDGVLPVDPVKIARAAGVVVEHGEFSDGTVVEAVLRKGNPVIRVARGLGELRFRFAVAHSLAHVCLHRDLLRREDEPK